MNFRKAVVSVSLFAILALTTQAFADTAEVLPKGVSSVGFSGKFYWPIDDTWKDDGSRDNPAWKYNGALTSAIFPSIALVEAGFGMPAGSGNLGSTDITFKYSFQIYEFAFLYGITDNLSAGIKIPYWFARNDVTANLNTTAATLGKNIFYGQPGDPYHSPFIPLGYPGAVKLTANDVQQLIATQYGYKRVENWSNDGLGDIEAGLKYQFLKTPNWELAAQLSVLFPTGQSDDPDSLVDYGLGTGYWAVHFRSFNDYVGIKNLRLNATFKYDLNLPQNVVMRVPDNANRPITPNKEEVQRDPGDAIGLELSTYYEIEKGFGLRATYMATWGFRDKVSGHSNFRYDQLEVQTDYREQVYIVGLAYNTLAFYAEKKFPVPLFAFANYRNRFEGYNVFKSQYFEVGLGMYF
jgi:hypothetical protein